MRIDHVFAMLIVTWAICALLFWAIMGRQINDYAILKGRLDEHAERIEHLMQLKMNKPER